MARSQTKEPNNGIGVAESRVPEASSCQECRVLIPTQSLEEGSYRPSGRMHIDVQLTASAGLALAEVQRALREKHAKLANGRVVHSRGDVIHWLFQQIAAAK